MKNFLRIKSLLLLIFVVFCSNTQNSVYAQTTVSSSQGDVAVVGAQGEVASIPSTIAENKYWWQKIKIGGYTQLRYNDLWKTNPDLENSQGDSSYDGYAGFNFRRIRFKTQGQIHPRVFFYLQFDFASQGSNIGQLKDAYFDYSLDKEGRFKFRGGQSKIPFGFENMQSSQHRIGLDRADPTNSAFKDERDLGVGIHWATPEMRSLLKEIKKAGLKGTGDFGNVYLMVLNGQRANEKIPDVKKQPHIALRGTWPMKLTSGQIIEAGIMGYQGKYITTTVADGVTAYDQFDANGDPLSALNAKFNDYRLGASFVVYPQPFGFQAEYNVGKGPEYDYLTNSIKEEVLHGGYAQVMYRKQVKDMYLIPFSRFMYYKGGKKFEQDARAHDLKELEIGVECLINKALEFNINYTWADRAYSDSYEPNYHEKGQLIRIQFQVNY